MINRAHLITELRDKLPLWEAECLERASPGDKYVILSGYRSDVEQAAAYAVGRSGVRKNEPIITKRKPGKSAHNARDKNGMPASKAVDFGVVRYGKYVKDGDDIAYKLGGIIAEELGLEWSGRWVGSFKEAAHIQIKAT